MRVQEALATRRIAGVLHTFNGEACALCDNGTSEIVPSIADVIDLTELFKRSLKGGNPAPGAASVPAKKASVKRMSAKSAANDARERAPAPSKPTSTARTRGKPGRRKTDDA